MPHPGGPRAARIHRARSALEGITLSSAGAMNHAALAMRAVSWKTICLHRLPRERERPIRGDLHALATPQISIGSS